MSDICERYKINHDVVIASENEQKAKKLLRSLCPEAGEINKIELFKCPREKCRYLVSVDPEELITDFKKCRHYQDGKCIGHWKINYGIKEADKGESFGIKITEKLISSIDNNVNLTEPSDKFDALSFILHVLEEVEQTVDEGYTAEDWKEVKEQIANDLKF